MNDEMDIFLDSMDKAREKARHKKTAAAKAKHAPAKPAPPAGLGVGSWLVIGLVISAAVLFGIQLANQNQLQPQTGATAPPFALTTFGGQPFNLADFQGRVVVINFWASWCAPCRDEAADLQAFWEDYQTQGVVLIGVNWLDTESAARAFMAEFNKTYWLAPDLGEVVGKAYHIQGAPETFIIDANGLVAQHIVGPVTYDQLIAQVTPLLAGVRP